MSGKRIIITGGSGKVGQHVIEHLVEHGHHILNLDTKPLLGKLSERVHTLIVDITDAGQVYSALRSPFVPSEPFRESPHERVDAVIHLAAHPRIMMVPDNETYKANVIGTYNILEASCHFGIRKIILGSSICVYGVTYAHGDVDFTAFPVEEHIQVNPMDAYGLSKLCTEITARGFAQKFQLDIYVLRIGRVIAPEEYTEWFSNYVNHPTEWKVHGWSYTDARDLGKMCHLAVLQNGLGFQIFNATNDEITNYHDTESFVQEQCPNTPITRKFGKREAPISNQKIKDMLGFEQDHNWQKYYSDK